MNNIYVNLELPVNAIVKFNLIPKTLPTKAARELEEKALIADVNRALNTWYYSNG
jgi:hypothetical protein